MTNKYSPSKEVATPITSLPLTLMPLTPDALLPITRTSCSLKRTTFPLEDAIKICAVPSVNFTSISSSSSFK